MSGEYCKHGIWFKHECIICDPFKGYGVEIFDYPTHLRKPSNHTLEELEAMYEELKKLSSKYEIIIELRKAREDSNDQS